MHDEQPPASSEIIGEDIPDWWPYAAEFPHWHVWRGVCGLVYARRPRTSPPLVVRAANPKDLLTQAASREFRSTAHRPPLRRRQGRRSAHDHLPAGLA